MDVTYSNYHSKVWDHWDFFYFLFTKESCGKKY